MPVVDDCRVVVELGEGFNGSTDMLKYIYRYLFH